jgi:hypothetical protein
LTPDIFDSLTVDMATYVLRKPEVATWETKFNPEFRNHFVKMSQDLEFIYGINRNDSIYFFLIRDGRDQNGKANRGVGGRMVLNDDYSIAYFEELFVTRIKDRAILESIGLDFMNTVSLNEQLDKFVSLEMSDIEWPDGRLFYSVQKSEWRYVD